VADDEATDVVEADSFQREHVRLQPTSFINTARKISSVQTMRHQRCTKYIKTCFLQATEAIGIKFNKFNKIKFNQFSSV